MNLADVLALYDYNYWATGRLLVAASNLTPEQFVTGGPFPWGGVRGTLAHMLDAEFSWRSFLQHGSFPTEELHGPDFATFQDLEKRFHEEESLMRAYLASLTDDAMPQIVTYTPDSGAKRERKRWYCLFHVVNHGTQHRAEAAALLTDLGQSPGDVDFTYFLSETHRV